MSSSPPASGPRGRVHRLGAKPRTPGEHGLPKPALSTAQITEDGVVGDFNVYRQEEKAGDRGMALLLLPVETVRALRSEGWPVSAGDFGENITTEGIPYEALAPGTRWRAGSVELEISKACTPCDNLWLLPYVGREKGPEFVRTTLDRRGWYARVTRAGTVSVGDPLVRLA